MKKLIPFLYFVLLSFAPVAPAYAAAPPQAAHQQKTLYQRLGGYDALAAVSDDFLGRLASDPSLGRFFVGLSTDSKVRVRAAPPKKNAPLGAVFTAPRRM